MPKSGVECMHEFRTLDDDGEAGGGGWEGVACAAGSARWCVALAGAEVGWSLLPIVQNPTRRRVVPIHPRVRVLQPVHVSERGQLVKSDLVLIFLIKLYL